MERQVVRYLYLVLSVFACLMATDTQSYSQTTNIPPNSNETLDTETLADSNAKSSGVDTKTSTSGTVSTARST